MKKIFIIIVLCFMCIGQVNASDTSDSFHLTDKIQNVYITRYNNTSSRNGAIYIIKDSNNNVVYCIEPFQPNLDSSNYEGYYNNYDLFKMTNQQVEKINLIAHYGYLYNNQNDPKWYIITQALIWRELGLSTYFTAKYHGDKVEMFNEETNTIINNVNNHYNKPNFDDNYSISINENLVLEDNNKVLNNYEIESDTDVKVEKVDNKLIISSKKEGNYKIKLIKKDKTKLNNNMLFYNNNSQNVFLPGKFDYIEKQIGINVYKGKINIKTMQDDNCEKTNLKGATYEVYNMSSFKQVVSTNSNNVLVLDNLPIDTYYIKQIKTSSDYKIDEKVYELELTYENNEQSIEVKNELVEGNCNIDDNTYLIDIPDTFSNDTNSYSIIGSIFILIVLGIILKYAKAR